jgi:hypothetical protein
MKKIPTIFLRRFDTGAPQFVTENPNPEAAWVFSGEGVATRKLDGTSCMVRNGALFKRREGTQEQYEDNLFPAGFELADSDALTGKVVGWVPVGSGPEDRWHREVFKDNEGLTWPDGTYELTGPKVQGNPERANLHSLTRHDSKDLILRPDPERTFAALKAYLTDTDIEGIVWHHPDGRMAKIKGKDFGLKRPKTHEGHVVDLTDCTIHIKGQK